MKPLRKIAFVVEEFALRTSAQQLVDRFLIGYRRDGEFHKLTGCRLAAHLPGGAENPELERRRQDFGLVREGSIAATLHEADAAVLIRRESEPAIDEAVLAGVIQHLPRGARCHVCGALAATAAAARDHLAAAAERGLILVSSAWPAVTWRLPPIVFRAHAPVRSALVVVPGSDSLTKLHGLESILHLLAERRGGETGVRRLRALRGTSVWRAGDQGDWSWPLLSAALSRSDSPQGDAVVDGRTQDLVALGLVHQLAKDPRGYLWEHQDGVPVGLLALDGVLADINYAVRFADGTIQSAQVLRAPAPGDEHFSRLAAVLEDFFRTGHAPWNQRTGVLTAGLLDAIRRASSILGRWLDTPELRTR